MAPAVVIIARHGPRLDAADQQWHLSTPTPYDPPLTYGGWNQSKALGVRIASLLHAREQDAVGGSGGGGSSSTGPSATEDGVRVHDFAQRQRGTKRRRKHRVVIHTSPYLRCLQTSVAIAAGMAQFQPPPEGAPRSRPSSSGRSRSPRLRGADAAGAPSLPAIAEPEDDLAHTIARKVLNEQNEQKHHRVCELRVDAFLGEWLNPSYFEHITPPPPGAMMAAAAKAELAHSEPIEVYTPSVTSRASHGSLWGGSGSGSSAGSRRPSRGSSAAQDDGNETRGSRSRANSAASAGSNDGVSGGRPPLAGHHHRPPASHNHTSTVPKADAAAYAPPKPHYAVSGSDSIPRGYVTHARDACVHVDTHWDSSREPQDWGDGGELGEAWSSMHKRFRRGLNHLIEWYSQHEDVGRAEDPTSHEQAGDEEEEDLVLILVTHGAGSNALIGALTSQPVLLDVGSASLTMAVRKDDAPNPTASSSPPSTPGELDDGQPHRHRRRRSLDLSLSSMYEMKLVSSSEHLRPGADPTRLPSTSRRSSASAVGQVGPYRQRFTASGPDAESLRSHVPASLGSVRRPSASQTTTRNVLGAPAVLQAPGGGWDTSATFSPGLWTPPLMRSPLLPTREENAGVTGPASDAGGRASPAKDLQLDSRSPAMGPKPTAAGGDSAVASSPQLYPLQAGPEPPAEPKQSDVTAEGSDTQIHDDTDTASQGSSQPTLEQRHDLSDTTYVSPNPPAARPRSLSQRGLWSSPSADATMTRTLRPEHKRRWTVDQEGRENL